jgi:hypothetical protein
MLKTLLACAVAAACAAIIVGSIPESTPAAASALTDGNSRALNIGAGTSAAPRAVTPGAGRKADCRQAWPYYEATCLNDSQQASGKSRVIRVIALDRATTKPTRR